MGMLLANGRPELAVGLDSGEALLGFISLAFQLRTLVVNWTDRIGRRIKLSDLHVFLTVAQTRSMAAAASELSVSNPVVSRSIAQLEHALGVRLLERNAKGVVLTEFGHALQLRSHCAFDELRQGVRDIEHLQDPAVGEIRIGTTATLAASFVARVLLRLREQHPGLRVHVLPGEAEGQLRQLRERSLDLLIHRRIEGDEGAALDFELLFQSPYVIVAGAQNPLVRRSRVDLARLIDEPWVLPPPGTRFATFIADAFMALGLTYPRGSILTTALEMRTSLLRSGLFLTAVPEFWLQFAHSDSGIKKLRADLPNSGSPIGISTLRNRTLGAASLRFTEVVRKVARDA